MLVVGALLGNQKIEQKDVQCKGIYGFMDEVTIISSSTHLTHIKA